MDATVSDLEAAPIGPAARAFLAAPLKMQIGAEAADARSGKVLDVFNPATGAVIAQVPAAGAEDVDRAVAAARAALGGEWSRLRPADRERLILELANRIEAD